MRLLLDTHALIWLMEDDTRIGKTARDAVIEPGNDVFVSVVSFWEIAVKTRIGKLGHINLERVMIAVSSHGFEVLRLELHHLAELIRLPFHSDHRDPFDHLLIAQAIAEELIFLSEDQRSKRYPIKRLSCSDTRL